MIANRPLFTLFLIIILSPVLFVVFAAVGLPHAVGIVTLLIFVFALIAFKMILAFYILRFFYRALTATRSYK